MRRVVSLYLPRWPTDRWRRRQGRGGPPAETPVVVIGRRGARKLVLDADLAARRLGVAPGLAVAQAQARVPGLHRVEEEPDSDAAALNQIALWALRRYSPLVTLDGTDGLWIEAGGCAHLFGGEDAMLQDMGDRLAGVGVSARVAMASAPGAAHALARYGQHSAFAVGPAEEAARVAALPVTELRLASEVVTGLGKLGFETLGDGPTHGGGPDARDPPSPKGVAKPRDIYIPDLALGSGIKVPTRDFR